MTSPEVRESAPSERFRWLRELGSSALPTWAALDLRGAVPALGAGAKGTGQDPAKDGAQGGRLVVVQRAFRGRFEDAELADWVRDARRIAVLSHPNVVRVRDAVIRRDDVLVVGNFVDGVRWSELAVRGAPLAVALRVFVDVLSGLGALHNLRDAAQKPLGLIHGALSPDAVLVGSDGVARLVDCVRPAGLARARASEGGAYRAPEVLLGDATADQRADVYSAGVMLWEALSGARLFDGDQPSTIVTTLLSGRVPRATVPPDAPWAASLEGTIARALSAEPEKRFPSASEMAAEIRRIVGARLAAATRVAGWVDDTFGEAIRKRRRELEGPPVASRTAPVDLADDAIEVEELEVASAVASAPALPAAALGLASVAAPPSPPPAAQAPTPAPVAAQRSERPGAHALTPAPLAAQLSERPPAHALTPAPAAPSYDAAPTPARTALRRRGAAVLVAGAVVLCLASWATVRSVRSEPGPGSTVVIAAPAPRPLEARLPVATPDPTPQPPEAPPAPFPAAADVAPDVTPASAPASPARQLAPAARTRPAPKHSYEPQGI